MKKYSALVAMSAAWATSNVAQAAIAFVTSLVVARGLGTDGFGRWTLCMAWAAMLTMMFDLGFGVLLTREAARDTANAGHMVGAALVVRLGLLVPAALVFAAAAPWLATEPSTAAALRIAPLIAGAGIAYTCLAAVFRAWPKSLAMVLTIEAVGALIQCAGAWWMLRRGAGVVNLLTLTALVQAAQFAAVVVLWRRSRGRHGAIAWPTRTMLSSAVGGAWPFALAGLVANAQLRLAPLMLGFMSSAAAVASFGAAARIGSLVRMLPQSGFAGALPALTAGLRDGSARAMRSRFDRPVRAFAVASALALAVFAGPIVKLLYGPLFSAAGTPLVWIAVGLVPALVNGGRKVFLYAAGREQVAVRWSGVALVIQAIGCVTLIPDFGAAGAAAALVIGEAAVWWPLHRLVQIEESASRPVGVVSESPLAG